MLTQNEADEQARWLKEKEVSDMTGISMSTSRKQRLRQVGIRYSKVGRSVRYEMADVQAFMRAHAIEPRG